MSEGYYLIRSHVCEALLRDSNQREQRKHLIEQCDSKFSIFMTINNKNVTKVSKSCFNSANQTKRQSIDLLVCQPINHFDVVIFGSLEAIVIESKWSYHIYRLLTEVCH